MNLNENDRIVIVAITAAFITAPLVLFLSGITSRVTSFLTLVPGVLALIAYLMTSFETALLAKRETLSNLEPIDEPYMPIFETGEISTEVHSRGTQIFR